MAAKLTTAQSALLTAISRASDNDSRIMATEGYRRSTVRALERRGLITVERYWTTETRGWNGVCYPSRSVMQYRTITAK